MKPLILAAMDCEVRPLREAGLECLQTGIGKVNAARAAVEAILTERPDAIISTGCAGGMAPGLRQMDVVIASETAYHDVWCGEPNPFGLIEGQPQRFPADPVLLEAAFKAAPYAHKGLIVTGDQFFISLEEDRRILGLYPDALAADMESAAIAQVCRHYGVPFLSVRVISDVHTSEKDQKLTYDAFRERFCAADAAFLKKLVF